MGPRKDLPRSVQALLAGAGVALFVGLLQLTGFLELWELKSRDLRTRWTLRPDRKETDSYVRPDLYMIDVTDESLRRMDERLLKMGKGGWPWPREIQAELIKACTQAKATAILYDFILAEIGNSEDTDYMVRAVREAPPTYLAGGFREAGVSSANPGAVPLLKRAAIDVDSDGSISVPNRYVQVVLPAPALCGVASGLCDVSTPRDRDEMIRRYRLLSTFDGRWYPSFALAALMAREKASKVVVRDRKLTVGGLTIPIERDGSLLLRYYPTAGNSATPFAKNSAWNVLNSEDVRFLEGKTVIVGTGAAGLTDLRQTPVDDILPGPFVHLTALSNILNGEYLREAPAWISLLLFSFLAVGVALATRHTSAALGGAIAAGTMMGAVGICTALYANRWIVDLVPQMLAVGVAFAATSAVNFLHEGRQRLRVKREFGRYVSPKVVDKILRHPDAMHLEGERKPLTIFFMDFAGFTAMSEKLDPSELVKLISEYHNEAAGEIFKTEGTLDKFIGDAIMAFWNDPIEQPDHALRACLTAIGAQKKLLKMAELMRQRGLPEMSARIGLNTGIATVGNMGSKEQFGYTLIGDEVNLASRLEGVNKEFGTKIIVSEATYQPAKEQLAVRELALIKVKGKKLPVRIYELIGLRSEVPSERMVAARKFETALSDFRGRKFREAAEVFRALGDPASGVYVELCERYLKDPPAADWDGSYQMEHK